MQRTALFSILFCLLCLQMVFAQTPSPLEPPDRSSPIATYESFMSQARDIEGLLQAYRQDKTAQQAREIRRAVGRIAEMFDLTGVAPAARSEVGSATYGYLFDIFLRLPEPEPGDMPPDGGSDLEVWTYPGTEIEIAKVSEPGEPPEFRFSAETVTRLPGFHARIVDRPLLRPSGERNWTEVQLNWTGASLPPSAEDRVWAPLRVLVLGTPLWKVAAIVVLWLGVAAGVVIAIKVSNLVTRNAHAVAALALRLAVPAVFAALAYWAHRYSAFEINPSGNFALAEAILAEAALYVAAAWAAWLLCYLVVEAIISAPLLPSESYDAHLLRLIGRVLAVVLSGAILLYGGDQVGIPAFGLLAGVGVGGVALALAAQSTVENLFGGVSIFADKPFRVGSFIRYGDEAGTVERIGPRSSRIRGLDGTLTTVPNSDLAKMHIVNVSARNQCVFAHVIGLRYETSRHELQEVIGQIAALMESHPKVGRGGGLPRVRFIGLGDSALSLEVRAFIETTDWGEFLDIQQELLFAIMDIVAESQADFAFPSQTVYLRRDPTHGQVKG